MDHFYKDANIKKIEKEKIEEKIKNFLKNSEELLIYHPKESSSSASSSKDILSSSSNEINVGNGKQKIKINKEIKGDFDVIIQNVKKENFLKMLEKNFYSKKANKCIIYDQEKINHLPQNFIYRSWNLFFCGFI